MLLIAALLLAACSSDDTKEAEKEVKVTEVPKSDKETEKEVEPDKEDVYRVAYIDLDTFIETYNELSKEADVETIERNGNESVVTGGLSIHMNDDGTVARITQSPNTSEFVFAVTLFAIEEQMSLEDADKIFAFIREFSEALDKEESFIKELAIRSMTINVNMETPDTITFEVLGDVMEELEIEDVEQEEGTGIVKKSESAYPENDEEIGKGALYTEKETLLVDANTTTIQLNYELEDFDSDKEAFFYLNEKFLGTIQGGDIMSSIDLKDWMLELGAYELVAVQFEDNNPENKAVHLSKAQYEVEEGS